MRQFVIRWIFMLLFCLGGTFLFSQTEKDTLDLNMYQVIRMAQGESPNVLIAETRLRNRYWNFQSVLANYKPQINLTSNSIPNLNRSIDVITLPDGSDVFIQRSLMRNSVDIELSQNIGFTGGTVFARTGLQRIDIFETDNNPRSTSYLSTPISIGIVQPFFAFNPLRWDREIEPLAYEEARRDYSEDLEQVASDAVRFYFDVLIAQLNVQAAEKDLSDADTLYEISQKRFEVGRIAETDLLQTELNVRKADAGLAQATLSYQSSTEQLRDFLGIREAIGFKLDVPTDIPDVQIDPDTALHYAWKHRSESLNYRRRLLEADREVAQARGNTGIDLNIFGSFGLSQTATDFSEVYKDPLDNEQLSIGIDIPIADWGKTQSRRQTAISNRKLIQMQVEQERVNFEREIILKVQQFDLVRQQVTLAKRAYDVAQRRNYISRQRYLIGKIGITELNLALSEQEAARQSYFQSLRNFWLAYYDIRNLTLYDFEQDRPLIQVLDDYDKEPLN